MVATHVGNMIDILVGMINCLCLFLTWVQYSEYNAFCDLLGWKHYRNLCMCVHVKHRTHVFRDRSSVIYRSHFAQFTMYNAYWMHITDFILHIAFCALMHTEFVEPMWLRSSFAHPCDHDQDCDHIIKVSEADSRGLGGHEWLLRLQLRNYLLNLISVSWNLVLPKLLANVLTFCKHLV